jgi:uncharacterized protein YuzE
MKIIYRKDTDTMRISFRDDLAGYDSEEVAPGVVVDFAETGEVVGMEIYDAASSKFDLSKFVLERREKDGIQAHFDIATGFLQQEAGEVKSI